MWKMIILALGWSNWWVPTFVYFKGGHMGLAIMWAIMMCFISCLVLIEDNRR